MTVQFCKHIQVTSSVSLGFSSGKQARWAKLPKAVGEDPASALIPPKPVAIGSTLPPGTRWTH